MNATASLAFGIALDRHQPFPTTSNFDIRPESSMSFLQSIFQGVGLAPVVSSNNLRIPEPTDAQKLALKTQGIDVSAGKVMFQCSPRSQARGF